MTIDKFNFLLNCNIGIYNKCEIIEVFGLRKESNELFNIYSLVIFEDTEQIDTEELMTKKLQKFQGIKDISWGIKRRIVDIEIAKELFNKLATENLFQIDKKIEVGLLKLLSEQYLQSEDSFITPQLNYLLKNNFHSGSYLLEFFDEDKSNCKFLIDNPVVLNSFSENISDILPIKVANLSDRLGNIIFQFPINNLKIAFETIKCSNKYAGIKIQIDTKNNNFDIKNLTIRLYEENDNVITRHLLVEVQDNITDFFLDDCFGTTIEIYDRVSRFLVYKNKFSIMKQMNFNMKIMEHQQRVFNVKGEVKKIQVSHHQNSTFGEIKQKEFIEWIQNRKYVQERKELERSKAFIQYFENQEIQALEDVRELIKKYAENGVYLWDPYLSAEDIKNTMYYCENAYAPLKAISGLKQRSNYINNLIMNLQWSDTIKKVSKVILLDFQYHINDFARKSQKQQNIHEMQILFSKDNKEFLFLNLEVRGKIGANGYDFHDRFLIFPLEQPRVWSLGISVNQLGKSHHILQEVKNAQHILNAFNQLWDALDKEECLVWKSK